jgi:hypothetical protein
MMAMTDSAVPQQRHTGVGKRLGLRRSRDAMSLTGMVHLGPRIVDGYVYVVTNERSLRKHCSAPAHSRSFAYKPDVSARAPAATSDRAGDR